MVPWAARFDGNLIEHINTPAGSPCSSEWHCPAMCIKKRDSPGQTCSIMASPVPVAEAGIVAIAFQVFSSHWPGLPGGEMDTRLVSA